VYVVIHFGKVYGIFQVEANLCRFFIVYLYLCCSWRFNYQRGCDPINW